MKIFFNEINRLHSPKGWKFASTLLPHFAEFFSTSWQPKIAGLRGALAQLVRAEDS